MAASKPIRICDLESLQIVEDTLRDSVIPRSEIRYDSAQNSLHIVAWQLDNEIRQYERLIGPVYRRHVPSRKWLIIFHGVERFTESLLPSYNRSEQFSLGALRWNKFNELKLETYDGLQIVAQMPSLVGEALPTDDTSLDRGKSTITSRWKQR